MTRRPLALALAGALLALGTAVAGPGSPAAADTLADAGYGETTIRGTYGSADLFVPLAADRTATGARVSLQVDASPLLTRLSTLTVLAGGVSLTSTRLAPVPSTPRVVTVDVPGSLIGDNGVALSVRTYLRVTEDDCEDPTNPALWVRVRPGSTVDLRTAPRTRTLDLVGPLLVGRSGPGLVGLSVPARSSARLLEAAGVAAAAVGRLQALRGVDAQVTLAPPLGTPVVALEAAADGSAAASQPSDTGLRRDGAGLRLGDRAVAAGEGVLALRQSAAPALLVAGATDADLVTAARALHDPARRATLAGPAVTVASRGPAGLPQDTPPWTDGAASLAQLGLGRQDVSGLGTREVTYTLDRPGGWSLREGGRLDLVVDASAALRPETSTVAVRVGGQELGSQRLLGGPGPRTYRFTLPTGLLDRALDGRPVRTLDLTVRFSLDVPHERCEPLDPSLATASVLPTTAFRLPHDTVEDRELARFPAPLYAEDEEDRRPVVIVLPRDPDRDELAAGVQVAAALGRHGEVTDPAPLLATTAELPDDLDEHGLVLVGDAAGELRAGTDVGTAPVAGAGSTAAVLALVDSPYDEGRSALVVRGSGAGLLLAATSLGDRATLASLRGDRTALSVDLPAQVLRDRLAAEGDAGPPEALAPTLEESFLDDRPWFVPGLVLAVGFLVAVGLWVRYRWRRA